jgi:CBS domain-containing protein
MNVLCDFLVPQNATLLDAVRRIQRNHSRAVVVTEREGEGEKVIGVISEGDVMRALLQGVDVHAPLDSFVRVDFKFLRNRDLVEAMQLFSQFGITMVPIVDDRLRLQAVVTLRDVLSQAQIRGVDELC